MRRRVTLVAIAIATTVASAAHKEAAIEITINPEVRVSVARGDGPLPPAVVCGEALEVPVHIVNRGFLTAPLEATLVDSVPEGASVLFSGEPLTGMREERRTLRITLTKPGLLDVTVAFRAKRDISDLGGRDRVHLLVECRSAGAEQGGTKGVDWPSHAPVVPLHARRTNRNVCFFAPRVRNGYTRPNSFT